MAMDRATVLTAAAAGWQALLDLLTVANRVRFSAILVFAGGFVLNYHDQGQEIVILIADAGALQKAGFFGAVAAWAMSAWYCARTLCDRPFARPETPALRRLTDHLPRLLGAAAFAAVAAAFWRQGSAVLAWVYLAGLAAFYAFAMFRRKGRMRRMLGLPGNAERTRTAADNFLNIDGGTATVFGILLLAAAVAFVAALADPVGIGTLLGPGIIAVFGFALIIPAGTLLVLMGLESRFPVITALLALAVLFSLVNDNHALRRVAGTEDAVAARPTLDAAFAAWHGAQCAGRPAESCRPPLVLVATAGGGSRAAYWTATVLGALSDATARQFDDRLFAVSGVSGGALGAVIHRATVSHRRTAGAAPPACKTGRGCGTAVAGGDFLGPLVATALYPDLLQRFLPVAVFDDRAATLEKSWEVRWQQVFRDSPIRLSDGLLALWPDNAQRPWPALYLNGTHVESARRIVTSNIAVGDSVLAGAGGRKTLVHADAFDFYAIHPCDIPASTAAHNTARFPYVAPAGRIRRGCDGGDWGHIVDGGYFENFGAQTVHELLQALARRARDTGRGFVPVVIQISSDPDFDGAFSASDHDGLIAAAKKSNPLAREILSPPRAFMGLRGAHGRRAYAGLVRGVAEAGRAPETRGAAFVHFRMCKAAGGERTPALGWSLSAAARRTIDGFLPDTADTGAAQAGPACARANAEALGTVLRALAGPP